MNPNAKNSTKVLKGIVSFATDAELDKETLWDYTKDFIREDCKLGTGGEVPQVYKEHWFQLAVSGERWALPTASRPARMQVTLAIRERNAAEFVTILGTETVSGERGPQFASRATFQPLSMKNSQDYASRSILELQVIMNEAVYFSTRFTLSDILWDQKVHICMDTYEHPRSASSGPKRKGIINVNVIRCRSVLSPPDKRLVSFDFQVSNDILMHSFERKLFYAICSVAEKGQWSRLYFSSTIEKPSLWESRCFFPNVTLPRTALTGHSERNPIRVELYGFHQRGSLLLGFSQFSLPEVKVREQLPWVKTKGSYLSARMRVKGYNVALQESKISLLLVKLASEEATRKEFSAKLDASRVQQKLIGGSSGPVSQASTNWSACEGSFGSMSNRTDTDPCLEFTMISASGEIVRFPEYEKETTQREGELNADELGGKSDYEQTT